MKLAQDEKFVVSLDDMLSPELCQEIIQRFKADPNKTESFSAGVSRASGINQTYREGLCISISHRPEWKDIDGKLFDAITKAAQFYMEKFNIVTDSPIDTGYTICGFEPDQKTNPHIDCIHGKSVFRLVTVIVYLATIEGGETVFPDIDVQIKPVAGRIALFPPYYTHRHESNPSKDERFIALTWICSNPKLYQPGEGV